LEPADIDSRDWKLLFIKRMKKGAEFVIKCWGFGI
jgi:hypothetical protein